MPAFFFGIMKFILPILCGTMLPLLVSNAAIVDVGTPLPIEPVVINPEMDAPSIGWIDSSMFTDFESTPVSQQLEQWRKAEGTSLDTANQLTLKSFDPWHHSLEKLLQFTDAFPNEETLAYRTASLLYKSGKPQDALRVLERAIHETPDSKTLTELFLGILVTENQLERAATFAENAIIRFPESETVLFNAACAYAKMNNVDEALHYLGIAIQYDWLELVYLLNDGDFDSIRTEPRFKNLQDTLLFRLMSTVVSRPVDPTESDGI